MTMDDDDDDDDDDADDDDDEMARMGKSWRRGEWASNPPFHAQWAAGECLAHHRRGLARAPLTTAVASRGHHNEIT